VSGPRSEPPGAVVAGIGVVTAVGLSAAETAASVRARMTRFSQTAIRDRRFEPVTLAVLPDDALPPLAEEVAGRHGLTSRMRRMLRLATPALGEVVAAIPSHAPRPGLILSLPETETTIPFDGPRFLAALGTQSGGAFDAAYSAAPATGRAGGLAAIEQAAALVRDGGVPFMLAGGVDTYRDLYVLATLDREERLASSANLDGFIPGEGAAFVLVANPISARRFGLPVLAALSPAGLGFEPGHLGAAEPYRGDGLTATVRALLAHAPPPSPIAEVHSSMNGEGHWAKEWSVAYLRNRGAFTEDVRIHHAADCHGDLGAASGPAMVAMATLGLRGGYRKSPVLVYASSDLGPRAALLVSAP
jgi:3-oxoacyl-[acyl-carrier-protein] synthase-1